ncbi:alanine/glycine:cation symporter family protein [Thorsellia anophelis]|uniref:Alanine or glycine:cation symporter, AGCS family n=1 Tax=Thorsellia anophelis DSM 18579 TaxID=1123402 RepID=A0A1I0A6U7_9GAMM|nr:amino acid carrier protein [Thorsellia anophelis]SES89715.1 alanine or glycine:cation symporter, AGCS family [Thorsellia anophelis DSM 18579]
MNQALSDFFNKINEIFDVIRIVSDYIWAFPTQYTWYASIPIIGELAMPIVILFGVGIYFTIRTKFIALLSFKRSVGIILSKQPSKTGVSALSAFMLGLAMRIGPGNIVGVTGAIAVGGPGALFWMWVAAFFGMTTAFMEAVLAQIFKEKKNEEFVGGLPFYGKRLLGNMRWVGVCLSVAFIIYALFNIPAQTFNVFSAIDQITKNTTGVTYEKQSFFSYSVALILILSSAILIFGGIRRVIKYVNILVPFKATLFFIVSIYLVITNITLIPYFFEVVIKEAFSPSAIFGGSVGVAIAQGVKRGLMSNEAGQGTITMAAAIADNRHPCEQGFVQSFGVFVDTMVICTLTGFIVIFAHLWETPDATYWDAIKDQRIEMYLESVKALTSEHLEHFIKILIAVCYGLFAFTTLLGMISFAEISANYISKKDSFILFIRILGACVFVPFGVITVLADLRLSNLWNITDLTNLMMVYLNIPILLLGAPLVYQALKHYLENEKNKQLQFDSDNVLGVKTEYWTSIPKN